MLNVVVVGGGLGGLSTAIALASSTARVVLLEADEEFSELGAGIQMPPNATRILRDWGLLDEVRSKATLPDFMTFRSYRDGGVLHKHEIRLVESMYGSPHLLIHRGELLRILVSKARALGVVLHTDSPVVDIDLSKPCVKTKKGHTFAADLIIGADGERSFCRGAILGRVHLPQPTGKLVYRFTIDSDLVRADTDFRHLIEAPTVTCWLGPKSHVVGYELTDRGVYNVALTCPDPIEGRAQFGPRRADMDEFKRSFSGWDPIFLKLLAAATQASYWTLLQLPEENRIWTDEQSQRIVLIGDAAHSMGPYLAQGASQAIEDGAFLGHLFQGDVDVEDIPRKLKIFCERRQARALLARSRAQEAGEVYELPDGPAQELRDRQMREGMLCEGFPNRFADPAVQLWLYGYDMETDVNCALGK